MMNSSKVITSLLLLSLIVSPAFAYPNITQPERIVCEDISETIMKCDRFIYDTGEFIETYYLNKYTNEYTIEITPDVEPEETVDDN